MSNRAQWYVILLASLFKWYQEISIISHRLQGYEYFTVWICYKSCYVVYRDEFLDTQVTELWIVSSMIHHASLYIVPGYKIFTTQRSPIWIFHRMTLNVFLRVVAEFKTTVTQRTMLCNIPGMAFHVYCLVGSLLGHSRIKRLEILPISYNCWKHLEGLSLDLGPNKHNI